MVMRLEPCDESAFKFGRSNRDCAAMIGVRDLPQFNARIAGFDSARVTNGDVAVHSPVNQQNRNLPNRAIAIDS